MSIGPSRRGQVSPFIVMDVMQAAADLERAGRDIIHLEVGQPSTGIPKSVIEPVQRLVERDSLGYTVASGIPELRHRISAYYGEQYSVDVPAERIFITTGSSSGFQLVFLSAFDAGDRVAMATPGYPAYRQILTSLSLEPVLLPVSDEHQFQPSVELLSDLSEPVQGLILASPSNPTGTVIPKSDFEALVFYCRDHDIRLISDEIYHGITYGADVTTTAGTAGPEIVVNSFSKYFSMTGWRIGWIVIPEDLDRSVECLAQNLFISPPTISQWAALYVLDAREELDANVAKYAENRSVLLEGLPAAGFPTLAPSDGAFYLYADIHDRSNDSVSFCQRMLQEAGVAVTPGLDFDPDRGGETLRISFAGSTPDMHEAINRLKHWRG